MKLCHGNETRALSAAAARHYVVTTKNGGKRRHAANLVENKSGYKRRIAGCQVWLIHIDFQPGHHAVSFLADIRVFYFKVYNSYTML